MAVAAASHEPLRATARDNHVVPMTAASPPVLPVAAAVGTSTKSRDDSPELRTSRHPGQGRVGTVRDRSPPRVVSPALTGAHASANNSHAAWTDYSSPAACKIDEAPTKTPLADIRSSPFIESSSAPAVQSYAASSTLPSPFVFGISASIPASDYIPSKPSFETSANSWGTWAADYDA